MRLDLLVDDLVVAELGVAGETIFIEDMPAGATEAIMLRKPLVGIREDHELPGYHRGTFQVIVRSMTHEVGESLANNVVAALKTVRPVIYQDVNEVFQMQINQMLPATLPIRFPRSTGAFIEWSINFDCSFVLPV